MIQLEEEWKSEFNYHKGEVWEQKEVVVSMCPFMFRKKKQEEKRCTEKKREMSYESYVYSLSKENWIIQEAKS